MDSAPNPGAAAEMFETAYELCQGVVGFMDVIGGSLCEDGARKRYAEIALAQAGGSAASSAAVSLAVLGGGCAQAAGFGAGKDPIPAPTWRQGRDDMGVDASAPVGSPIYAPAASTLVEVVPWFRGPCGMQPLMLFRFTERQAGTEDGDQYWYVAEQITPATRTIGTTFARGQPVARFARVRDRDRDRLGLADRVGADVGRADGRRGGREPRARVADPVGGELQALVPDARHVGSAPHPDPCLVGERCPPKLKRSARMATGADRAPRGCGGWVWRRRC